MARNVFEGDEELTDVTPFGLSPYKRMELVEDSKGKHHIRITGDKGFVTIHLPAARTLARRLDQFIVEQHMKGYKE